MSTLGSSVINKSGKKFGPKKAPIRRPAETEPFFSHGQHVDRQTYSQTPQTRASETATAGSPVPSLILHPAQSTHESVEAYEPAADQSNLRARASPGFSEPQRSASPRQPSPLPTGNRKHPSEAVEQLTSFRPGETPSPDIHRQSFDGEDQSQKDGHQAKRRRTHAARDEGVSARTKGRQELRSQIAPVPVNNSTTSGLPVVLPTTEFPDGDHLALTGANIDAQQQQSSSLEASRRKRSGPKSSRSSKAITIASDVQQDATSQTFSEQRSQKQNRKIGQRDKRRHALHEAPNDNVNDAVEGSSSREHKHRRKPMREPTPEEMRLVERDTDKVKLSELCSEDRIGKVSNRELQLRERDHGIAAEKARKELREFMNQRDSQGPGELHAADTGQEAELVAPEDSMAEMEYDVPSTMIDAQGDIVVNPEAGGIDRHANAAEERGSDPLPTVEENELSRKVTSGRWLKRDRSSGWSGDLLQRFYDGLQMFGTDFEMISRMFPGKSRRAIKLKFCREEKLNNDLISATLLGQKIEIDLALYEDMSRRKYKDPAEIERMMQDDRRVIEEQQAEELRARQAAEEQEREDATIAESADAEERMEEDGNVTQKKTRKPQKDGPSQRSKKRFKEKS